MRSRSPSPRRSGWTPRPGLAQDHPLSARPGPSQGPPRWDRPGPSNQLPLSGPSSSKWMGEGSYRLEKSGSDVSGLLTLFSSARPPSPPTRLDWLASVYSRSKEPPLTPGSSSFGLHPSRTKVGMAAPAIPLSPTLPTLLDPLRLLTVAVHPPPHLFGDHNPHPHHHHYRHHVRESRPASLHYQPSSLNAPTSPLHGNDPSTGTSTAIRDPLPLVLRWTTEKSVGVHR